MFLNLATAKGWCESIGGHVSYPTDSPTATNHVRNVQPSKSRNNVFCTCDRRVGLFSSFVYTIQRIHICINFANWYRSNHRHTHAYIYIYIYIYIYTGFQNVLYYAVICPVYMRYACIVDSLRNRQQYDPLIFSSFFGWIRSRTSSRVIGKFRRHVTPPTIWSIDWIMDIQTSDLFYEIWITRTAIYLDYTRHKRPVIKIKET